ncbi:MAG TPA: type II secretion system protein GspE [candidate division Zixibacteria bacterium]|nr:MAG TPA: type II secretion system protein GspE [Thermoplasmata archaeon]HBY99934.1 type II secretion system protein GspE [candidate division Zixibacteria bacterium]
MNQSLGEMLIDTGRITKSQYELAKREKNRTGAKFGEILERLGFINHEEVLEFVGQQTETGFIDFSKVIIDSEAVKLVPEEVARSCKLIPVEINDGTLTVAMTNPNDINAIDRLRKITKLNIEPKIADEETILSYVDEFYGMAVSPEKAIEDSLNQALSLKEVAEETPPLIKLVDSLIAYALKERTTDIHLEVDESVGRVRYRIDGVLQTAFILPKKIYRTVVSRIKIMSDLDITETRIPQDGSFRFKNNTQEIDVRVSTMPIFYGESVVMRLLTKPRFLMSLQDLGYWGDNYEKLTKMVNKPYGMVVITGPTGSGKSTTLFAALKTLNLLEKNLITLEDPVEYQIPMSKQSPTNEKAGYTFAKGLRSILRHDPDIILLGEMRDEETAEMAFRASMTGHLVFTTLHANSASSAVTRLLDMDIEPFVISTSLLAVIAQRLARRICGKCKEPYTPTEEELSFYPQFKELKNPVFHRGRGCEKCKHTGYRARIGIYEVLEVNETVNQLILQKALPTEIERASKMKTMLEDGIEKVIAGVTTIEEVKRVVG